MKTDTLEALPASKLVKDQKLKFGPRTYTEGSRRYSITATVRYDDQCGNGHNSFSITADIRGPRGFWCGGCCHEEVAKHFPELAPFIKWHLFDATGPMHYVANTLYHASDRDHNGLLKGEKKQIISGKSRLPYWECELQTEDGKPFKIPADTAANVGDLPPLPAVRLVWVPNCITGEGKARNLDAARSCAVWPEATDEQLTAPPEELKAMLLERLPALVAEFKRDVESLGFVY